MKYKAITKFFIAVTGIYMSIMMTIVFFFKHVFPYIREPIINTPYWVMLIASMFLSLISTIAFAFYVYNNIERIVAKCYERKRKMENEDGGK